MPSCVPPSSWTLSQWKAFMRCIPLIEDDRPSADVGPSDADIQCACRLLLLDAEGSRGSLATLCKSIWDEQLDAHACHLAIVGFREYRRRARCESALRNAEAALAEERLRSATLAEQLATIRVDSYTLTNLHSRLNETRDDVQNAGEEIGMERSRKRKRNSPGSSDPDRSMVVGAAPPRLGNRPVSGSPPQEVLQCAQCGIEEGDLLQCSHCRKYLHETCGGPHPRGETDDASSEEDLALDHALCRKCRIDLGLRGSNASSSTLRSASSTDEHVSYDTADEDSSLSGFIVRSGEETASETCSSN